MFIARTPFQVYKQSVLYTIVMEFNSFKTGLKWILHITIHSFVTYSIVQIIWVLCYYIITVLVIIYYMLNNVMRLQKLSIVKSLYLILIHNYYVHGISKVIKKRKFITNSMGTVFSHTEFNDCIFGKEGRIVQCTNFRK